MAGGVWSFRDGPTASNASADGGKSLTWVQGRTFHRLPLAEALDMSLSFGRWLVAVQAERVGAVTVLDRDELAADLQAANEYAAKAFAQ